MVNHPKEVKLLKNHQALKIQVGLLAAATLVTALLAAALTRSLFRAAFSVRWYTGFFILVAIIVLGLAAIFKREKDWRGAQYVLTPDAILVTRSNNLFGTKQEVYLYESIISVETRQSFLGTRYNYGDIVLSIPKLGSNLVLRDLQDLDKQLRLLQTYLKGKTNRVTLVT